MPLGTGWKTLWILRGLQEPGASPQLPVSGSWAGEQIGFLLFRSLNQTCLSDFMRILFDQLKRKLKCQDWDPWESQKVMSNALKEDDSCIPKRLVGIIISHCLKRRNAFNEKSSILSLTTLRWLYLFRSAVQPPQSFLSTMEQYVKEAPRTSDGPIKAIVGLRNSVYLRSLVRLGKTQPPSWSGPVVKSGPDEVMSTTAIVIE